MRKKFFERNPLLKMNYVQGPQQSQYSLDNIQQMLEKRIIVSLGGLEY